MDFKLKIIILTFFINTVFSGSSVAQNQWSALNSPTSRPLTDISFVNSNTGWICGDSGTIIHTTNGGNDWVFQNTGTFNNIEDIFFLNERLGWAVSYEIFPIAPNFPGTLMLTTTDGGNNWVKSMFPDTNMYLSCVYFLDSLKGFLGGVSSTIIMTTNSGESWTYTTTDSTISLLLPVFKIKFLDENLGYACGGFRDIAGLTWVTRDGGYNWLGTILAPEPFFDITILNDQKTICSGGDLEYGSSIARTTDQGNNWIYDTLGVFGLSYGIASRTQSEIWMASGYAEKFLYSIDTGVTWLPEETPGNAAVFDVIFTDSIYGYACGANGSILKYDRTSSSILNNTVENFPEQFYLGQNYPNPFNPETKISYYLSPGQSEYYNVNLRVFDVLGEEISLLVNDRQRAGNYEVDFKSAGLASGIYYYSLTVNGIPVSTRKMILLK